jgi:hypothetical protein
MEITRFELFGIEGSFEGVTNGDHWNGWECPRFTLEESLRFVDAWNAPVEDCGRGPARYDSEGDFFEFTIEGETDRFGPEIVEGVKLYPIGACGWCWETPEL